MTHFTFKFASIEHIPAVHSVRMSVKENALSNRLMVTEQDYVDMLSTKGNGWNPTGRTKSGEVRFEMEKNQWKRPNGSDGHIS